jgi:hypothetical protein
MSFVENGFYLQILLHFWISEDDNEDFEIANCYIMIPWDLVRISSLLNLIVIIKFSFFFLQNVL